MKLAQFVLALSCATLTSANFAHADQSPDNFVAMGSYVSVNNLAESEAFYSVLFDRSASVRLDDFIAFDIAGGWFAIVSRDKYAPDAAP